MVRISDKDLEVVKKQLKRNVNNVLSVAYRCSYGFPAVVFSYPIRNGKPFPTIHYLTCPHLYKEISQLEEKGFIKLYEERIESDETFRKLYKLAHEEVIKKRISALREDDKNSEWIEVFASVGTGGISNFEKVKCLHLHVADYLAGVNNPIGESVIKDFVGENNQECANSFCSRFL